jgi:integrase
MWRRYLALAHGYTVSHKDGMVRYTAHELRHVCASLLIASGASDVQVANQMGHRKIETTKNIYGHLFAQDRKLILDFPTPLRPGQPLAADPSLSDPHPHANSARSAPSRARPRR